LFVGIVARIDLMEYGDNTKIYFDVALKIFEGFCEQGSISKIEQTKFCIAVEKYLSNFNSWHSCSPAQAKAYQVFVRSTPLSPMLELPQSEWTTWLEKNISGKLSD
jgi:hypothetical protein